MAVTFRIAEHSVYRGRQVVEVLVDGEVAAAIYPEGEGGLKIVSAHFEDAREDANFAGTVVEDTGSGKFPPIPAFHIQLGPCPYVIVGGTIVNLLP